MGNDRKFRALAIAAICVAVVGVSVAYAALGAALDVTGTATVNTANSWSVTASDLTCTATGQATVGAKDGQQAASATVPVVGTAANWEATFKAPGDKVVCELTWTNGGSIDAAITKLVKSITGDETLVAELDYTVVMGSTDLTDTTPQNKYLEAQTNKKATITVTFDGDRSLDGDALVALNSKTATMTVGFEFAQALANETYTEL